MVLVESVMNQRDGTTALVTLDGSPVGTLGFIISQEPDPTDASARVASFSGTGPYVVSFPFPVLWYCFATDGGVASPVGVPVWIGTSNDSFLNEVGQAVRDLLWRHRSGIEARVQSTIPGLTLKQAIYGSAAEVEQWPAVVVAQPSYSSGWYAMPKLKLYHLRLSVVVLLVHETEQSQINAVAGLMEAMVWILSHHEAINLPSGAQVYFCQAEEGSATEQRIDDTAHWLAMASLQWSGDCLVQENV